MLKIIAQNSVGSQLRITQSTDYQLVSVTGLTPQGADVNTSPFATKDGSIVTGTRLTDREIVLTLQPLNAKVETGRINLYTYFQLKRFIRLYITTTNRSVKIDGYVSNINIDLNGNPQMAQITIKCPNPYFLDTTVSTTYFSSYTETITNSSDEQVGVVFEVTFTGAVTGLEIQNSDTGQTMGLDYTFASGDTLTINTKKGEKEITLTRSGTEYNLINYITTGTEWIYLEPGNNDITYSADSGVDDMDFAITVQPIYEGV